MGEKPSQRFSPSSNSQYAWQRAREQKLRGTFFLSLHQSPALLNLALLEGCARADQTTPNGPRHSCRRCEGQAIRAAHEIQKTFCTHEKPTATTSDPHGTTTAQRADQPSMNTKTPLSQLSASEALLSRTSEVDGARVDKLLTHLSAEIADLNSS